MTSKRNISSLALLALLSLAWFAATPLAAQQPVKEFDEAIFHDPPAHYRGHAMWGYNLSKVTESDVVSGARELSEKGHFGGFFISVFGANATHLDEAYYKQAKPFFELTDHGIEYLSPEFFRLYRLGLEEAKKAGLEVVFYDDYYYPSGTVCGQLYQKYPQAMAKRLDIVERDVSGPAKVELAIPEGTYIGAVRMNKETFERVDISGSRTPDGKLEADVPQGNWKVMAFYLNLDAVLKIRNPGIVNYLDEADVDKFIELSYDRFYNEFKEYYGPVIKRAFYDEPSMHWLDGRMWTPTFNKRFAEKYGYSPMKYYPALWYDIGPDTATARNALHGFRAQIYADSFVKRLNEWCNAHGIQLTGHMDQEEIPNPVPINGDLMKLFEHQAIPGADDVFWWGRSNPGYKVVTSAAFNYDKPVVMAETYAAYDKLTENMLFQVAMDQSALGINYQIPADSILHRVKRVPELNSFVGRLSYMLQHGRHVADIAILYPIASLQAAFTFKDGWEYAYTGGILPPEIDYMDVAETLNHGLRIDYTYLHPEVLQQRCKIAGRHLILDNKENREEYRLLVVPGGTVLNVATAERIRDFYRKGGAILATSRLAYRSAELGRDQEVQKAISEVFGVPVEALVSGKVTGDVSRGYLANHNAAGGRAWFLPKPEPSALRAILKEAVPVRDVEFQEPAWTVKKGKAYDGAMTYIHKVKNGRDIYFFANSTERSVDTNVTLRGGKGLSIWNPQTGLLEKAQYTPGQAGGEAVTSVRLVLPPVTALFFVQEPTR